MAQGIISGDGLLMFGCRIGWNHGYVGAFANSKAIALAVYWGYNSSLSYDCDYKTKVTSSLNAMDTLFVGAALFSLHWGGAFVLMERKGYTSHYNTEAASLSVIGLMLLRSLE